MDVNLELRINSFINRAVPIILDALPVEYKSRWDQKINVSTSDTDDYRWDIDDAIANQLPPGVVREVEDLFNHELGFSK